MTGITRLFEGLRVPYNRGMWKVLRGGVVVLLVFWVGRASVLAETPADVEGAVTVETLGAASEYPALTRGQVVVVNAQRYVVTREPLPLATTEQAPPAPLTKATKRPPPPFSGAIWVDAHWAYGTSGFTWVAGRYITPRRGHAFVPPRWAAAEDQYFYFSGFYVPYGVYVRSHFNRYYYSGTPANAVRSAHGPYWPVGAPTPSAGTVTSARANDPYWPIGARR